MKCLLCLQTRDSKDGIVDEVVGKIFICAACVHRLTHALDILFPGMVVPALQGAINCLIDDAARGKGTIDLSAVLAGLERMR